MTMRSTRDSFIVRVYRYDPENEGLVAGLVEATDGSGATTPFRGTDELAALLNGMVARRRKPGAANSRRRAARIGEGTS